MQAGWQDTWDCHNLVMFYDSNDIQLSTKTSAVTTEDTAKKYESWGWKVKTIDGNDMEQIYQALSEARDEKEKPFLIIGKTIMGKGAVTESGETFEREVSTHGMPLGSAEPRSTDPLKTWEEIRKCHLRSFPEVKEHFQKCTERKGWGCANRENRSQFGLGKRESWHWQKNLPGSYPNEVPSFDYLTNRSERKCCYAECIGNGTFPFCREG